MESTPVAKSVNLTANPENVVVGGSTTLTANVTELNSGAASNVKYTFTEVKEDGTTVGTPQELSTDTATFTDLTNGKHYYKVTVSADGYTSVTATVEVNVNQPYNVTAKYKITENGVTYEDKDSNKDIVSVNGEVTSNTSSGTVVAKNTITNGSSTYVFAGWESKMVVLLMHLRHQQHSLHQLTQMYMLSIRNNILFQHQHPVVTVQSMLKKTNT